MDLYRRSSERSNAALSSKDFPWFIVIAKPKDRQITKFLFHFAFEQASWFFGKVSLPLFPVFLHRILGPDRRPKYSFKWESMHYFTWNNVSPFSSPSVITLVQNYTLRARKKISSEGNFLLYRRRVHSIYIVMWSPFRKDSAGEDRVRIWLHVISTRASQLQVTRDNISFRLFQRRQAKESYLICKWSKSKVKLGFILAFIPASS